MVAKAKTYVFGDFRFAPSESLLRKQNEEISLPPKALDVLEKLVENAGSVVTKDDLLRDVWDDVAIEESAIARTVFLIRSALGDDPKNHTFIQTVPKRGYRFVAEVSTLNGSNGNAVRAEPIVGGSHIAAVDVAPTPEVTPRRLSSVHLVAALLLLAAVATSAYFGFFRQAPAPDKPTLLVMPVTSAAGQEGDDLENGLADALIHHLASAKHLTVRPMSATRFYSGKITDPIQAGREQKVNRVLSASYQRAEGMVRVTARLINIETGETEDSWKFQTGEAGVFAIQDALVADLGNKIARRLGASTGPVRSRGTSNEEAYRHYSQGMALFDKRNGAKAVESFERATNLDPNYALAWAGMAVALGAMPSLGDSDPQELYDKTVHAAERALALDPRLAHAYSALCDAKLVYSYDLAGAGQACAKAIELDPNSPLVLQSYSYFLVAQGRPEEAIQVIKQALDIEPTSFYSHRLYANTLYLARQYDAAYAEYVRLNELQPDRLPTHEWMIRTLEASGREAEALEWLIKLLRVRKADEAVISRIRQAYQASGWPGVLRERLDTEKGGDNYFRQAGMYARLGNKDAAFELLEKAFAHRSLNLATLRTEPQLDPLRDDPRFNELLNRVYRSP